MTNKKKKRYIVKPNASFVVTGSVPDLRVSKEEFDELKALADDENWPKFDETIASHYDGTWEEKAGCCDAEVEGDLPPEFVIEEVEE